jgi:hypothetical protein
MLTLRRVRVLCNKDLSDGLSWHFNPGAVFMGGGSKQNDQESSE